VLFRDLVLNLPGLAEVDAMAQTHIVCAGRIKPPVHTVMAEVAFAGTPSFLIKCDDPIGAGDKAGLTAGAQFTFKDHDSVIPFPDCLDRASLDTGWLVTMPTHIDSEKEVRRSVNHLRPVF